MKKRKWLNKIRKALVILTLIMAMVIFVYCSFVLLKARFMAVIGLILSSLYILTIAWVNS